MIIETLQPVARFLFGRFCEENAIDYVPETVEVSGFIASERIEITVRAQARAGVCPVDVHFKLEEPKP